MSNEKQTSRTVLCEILRFTQDDTTGCIVCFPTDKNTKNIVNEEIFVIESTCFTSSSHRPVSPEPSGLQSRELWTPVHSLLELQFIRL